MRMQNLGAWNPAVHQLLEPVPGHLAPQTAATLRRPQVVPITDQLRLILKDARQRTAI